MSRLPNCFLILIAGQIESAEFSQLPDFYVKFCFKYGPDWTAISGFEEGISQICRIGNNSGLLHLNFPIEITFQSTNPFGWPQIVLSGYGTDILGNDVVRGYGATHVPLSPGLHKSKVPMFTPESSSVIQNFLGWILGRRPELIDPKIVAQADGRETMHVRTRGFLNITWNVVVKDVKRLGFDVNPRSITSISEFPLQLLPNVLPQVAVPSPKNAQIDEERLTHFTSPIPEKQPIDGYPSTVEPSFSHQPLTAKIEQFQGGTDGQSANTPQPVMREFDRPTVSTGGFIKPEKAPRSRTKLMDTVTEEITEEPETVRN